ncbi:hypothetical protein [uncultured Cohaesibacter sp.]|uniref:hypothetical protein n=1 Tax=uncultured Cohaesibacter sp. TaxID=1002546 RepID=UPI0029C93CD8|nr:hypothetical protein [uncultured Cohaesibacter sp.]
MALPGKTIFDVTMMAGWAFAAVLIGLVTLTMVDDNGDTARDSNVVATLDNGEARLVTGSVPNRQNGLDNRPQSGLVDQQNKSFDPFLKSGDQSSDQLQAVLEELRSLKQEVAAFHVSTRRLRDENNRLQQRLVKLELNQDANERDVRVVQLPRRDNAAPMIVNGHQAMPEQVIDLQATGSIRSTPSVPRAGEALDTLQSSGKRAVSASVQVREEPLDIDTAEKQKTPEPMLPRVKPIDLVGDGKFPEGAIDPQSEVVAKPAQATEASRTAFGLDLGSFVSFSEIEAAWKEVSGSQKDLLGDLSPRTWVSQGANSRISLNLIVGPIQNAADAAALCARLKFQNYACNVATYRGQDLALN